MTDPARRVHKEEVVPKLMEQVRLHEPDGRCRASARSRSTWAWARPSTNKKILENAVADMAKIAGQKPIVTKSRVSVASLQDPRRLADRLQGHAAPRRACTSSSIA